MTQNSILLGCEPVQSIETWKMLCFYKRFKPKNCTKKSQKLGLFPYFRITVYHPVCWVLVRIFTNKILQIFPVKFVFGVNGCIKNRRVQKNILTKFLHKFNMSGVWKCLTKKNCNTAPFMLSCCGIFIFLHEGSQWCFLMIPARYFHYHLLFGCWPCRI